MNDEYIRLKMLKYWLKFKKEYLIVYIPLSIFSNPIAMIFEYRTQGQHWSQFNITNDFPYNTVPNFQKNSTLNLN